jgi:phosphohistidine phosphatase
MEDMASERRLVIMRHAKAGELPGGPDFERALRGRGRRNADAAGAWLADQGFLPDLVLCSKARRARQTWQYVSARLPAQPQVRIDERLYLADAGDLLGLFAQTPTEVMTLMYVGHNPAAAEVTEVVTAEPVDFPTAAVAVIGLSCPWAELSDGAGQLIASWIPGPQA